MSNNFGSDLTGGSVGKQLLKFCIPFLLSNLLQALYNIADMFIVGQFDGSAGISGVSNGGQVTMMIINFVAGLAVGATVLVAQHVGAKRHEEAEKTVATVFTMMAISGIAISVIMAFLSEPIMRLIQTPEESFEAALDYVRICSYGIIFTFLYNAISGVMRGLGDSKHPLIFVAIACFVNIFLDLLLVGAFKMSAAGAALATIISQAISVIISVIYLKKNGFMFDFKLKSFRIHKDTLFKILKIGFPSAIQNVVTSLSFMIINVLVNGYGVHASAAAGIAGKFNSVAILPILAMSMSVASMAGQNIGAKLYDRALDTMKTSIKISFVIGGAIFLFVQIFPSAVISIFDNTPEVVEYGVQYIRAFSFDYIIVPIVFSVNGLLNGAGHTAFSLFNGMLSAVLLRAPFAILLGKVFSLGMLGIGLGGPIASLGSAIIGLIYVQSGRWKLSKIESK
ncbi:MAG: MATE family efflux transporter [Clostridia bacterium]|nr:MATE family efflux transporter [Clostridia bacterium]